MSNRDRIFPDTTSLPQMTRISRYFRFLTKICVFPVIIDNEKQNVSFKFCSFKFLLFNLYNIVTFSVQQAGPFLSFDQNEYLNATTKLFQDGALTDNLSILSFFLALFLIGFCLLNFYMNMGKAFVNQCQQDRATSESSPRNFVKT